MQRTEHVRREDPARLGLRLVGAVGREVDHHGRADRRDDPADRVRVGQVDRVELDVARDLREPPRLRSGTDEGMHVIPPCEQIVHRGGPDESGGPGHQDGASAPCTGHAATLDWERKSVYPSFSSNTPARTRISSCSPALSSSAVARLASGVGMRTVPQG